MPSRFRAFALFPVLAVVVATATAEAKPRPTRRGHPRTGLAPTPFDALVKAVKRNDRGAVERIAARMGPARLTDGLYQSNPAIVLAVLAAVPRSRGAVVLVSAVADLTTSSDGPVAGAAARAVGVLLDGESPSTLEEWEVPPDVVGHACGALRALALRSQAPLSARLAALEAIAEASSTCPGTEELAPLLKDPAPAVRRATVLVLGPPETRVGSALREAIRDPNLGVVAAAVAVLCRAGGGGAPAGRRRAVDPLTVETVERARALVVAQTTAPEDAVEMLACLVAARTPADRKLLDQLRRGPPSALRDRAAELAEGADAVKPQ